MRRSIPFVLLVLFVACDSGKDDDGVEVILGRASAGPGSINQSVTEGGPNPTDTTITVTNDGNCAVDYTATSVTVDGRAWLSVAPGSGTVAGGSSSGLTATIDVIGTALRGGTYTGTIQIDGDCATTGRPATGSPALIAVTLTVATASASIAVDDLHIDFDSVPLQDQWRPTSGAGAPIPRSYHSAIWTGYEMIIFGGQSDTGYLGDGAAYDPATDTWRPIASAGAPSPRWGAASVWTGTEMFIWSGGAVGPVTGGGLYDPTTDSWRTVGSGGVFGRINAVTVWTGTEILIWGGSYSGLPRDDGVRYDPALNQFTMMAQRPVPNSSTFSNGVWTGAELIVYEDPTHAGAYDPVTDTWRELSNLQAPPDTEALIWTGREMITLYSSSPATYNPGTDDWGSLSASFPDFAPTADLRYTTAFSGQTFIMWDSDTGLGYYRLLAGMPVVMDLAGSPGMRAGTRSVWTGTGMIVWGGAEEPAGTYTNTGAIYE